MKNTCRWIQINAAVGGEEVGGRYNGPYCTSGLTRFDFPQLRMHTPADFTPPDINVKAVTSFLMQYHREAVLAVSTTLCAHHDEKNTYSWIQRMLNVRLCVVADAWAGRCWPEYLAILTHLCCSSRSMSRPLHYWLCLYPIRINCWNDEKFTQKDYSNTAVIVDNTTW